MAATLRINEIFTSINGESTLVGLPFVFVRTTGCPLRCSWCDTTYAYEEGEDLDVDKIADWIADYKLPRVLLTGGEPLMQPAIFDLMKNLLDRNLEVILETSGAISMEGLDPRVQVIMDIKTPSSGMSGMMHWDNIKLLKPTDQVKVVLAGREDYDFAKETLETYKLRERCEVIFQPVFGSLDPKSLIEWVLADLLDVRCMIQQHKVIWPPDQRGV